MKKFAVAILSYFDNENKVFLIEAENRYEALKKGVIQVCSDEECKEDEIIGQEDKDYPKDYDSLVDYLFDQELSVGCIEI